MAKRKPKLVLDSEAACEIAMTDYLLAISDVKTLEAEQGLAVAEASAKFETHLNDAKTRRDETEAALRTYYYAHLDDVEKGAKHWVLANGTMGRRDNPAALKPLNRNWTWASITVMVRSLWGGKYFHEPKPAEIDKDALKKLDAAELEKAGLKTESTETFYIEPHPPKVTE